MKHLLVLTLIIVGCTSQNDGELKQVKYDLLFISKQLQTCQAQLEDYRSANNSSSNYDSQKEVNSKPTEQYEEVEYVELVNEYGIKCYSRDIEECGMSFFDCENDYIYRCMKDAKYKIQTEKKLVK